MNNTMNYEDPVTREDVVYLKKQLNLKRGRVSRYYKNCTYSFSLKNGDTLPGRRQGEQIEIKVAPNNHSAETQWKWLIRYGRDSVEQYHISSERVRGVNGRLEPLGPVRKGDIPYLIGMYWFTKNVK